MDLEHIWADFLSKLENMSNQQLSDLFSPHFLPPPLKQNKKILLIVKTLKIEVKLI